MTQWILFHTPQQLDTLDSGSSVRPARMLEAFESLGYNVDAVVGDADERKRKIKSIKQNNRNYSFCYSEPTAWPLNTFVDYRLYYYLWSEDIPTGIFYRDVYWKFPNLMNQSGLKNWELQLRYRLDLAVFTRLASKLYVPSSSFGDFLDVDCSKSVLPPGGSPPPEISDRHEINGRFIYVGGLYDRYGGELLIEAADSIAEGRQVHFDLVCRKSELSILSSKIRNCLRSDWASVHHVSGEELKPLLDRADVGIIPFKPTQYNNMALPVKLFEYLSHGLPVVTTNCTEISKFVETSGCGLTAEPTSESLSERIKEVLFDEGKYQSMRRNAIQTINQNEWTDRALKVSNHLDITQ